MGATETLKYEIVFEKQTGNLVAVQKAVDGLGDSASKAGRQLDGASGHADKHRDALEKLGNDMGKLPAKFLVFDVLKNAIMSAAQSSEGLNSLKAGFEETSKSIVGDFEPTIRLASNGIQALLLVVQGVAAPIAAIVKNIVTVVSEGYELMATAGSVFVNLAHGEIRGALHTVANGAKTVGDAGREMADDWKEAGGKMADSFGKVVDTASGAHTAMTEKQRAALQAQLAAEQEHAAATANLRKDAIDYELGLASTGFDRKRELLEQREALELDILKVDNEKQTEALRLKYKDWERGDAEYNAAVLANTQQYNDKRSALVQDYAQRGADLARARAAGELQIEESKLAALAGHAQAELEMRKLASEEILAQEFATSEQKKEAIRSAYDAQLETLRVQIENERTINEAKHASGLISAEEYTSQKIQLAQKEADKTVSIRRQCAHDEKVVDDQRAKELADWSKSTMTTWSSAVEARYNKTKDANEAMRALGREAIETVTQEIQKKVILYGVEASAASLAKAGGVPWGIPAMLATMAVYASLAAAIGVAGGAIANAADPGGASTSSSSSDTGGSSTTSSDTGSDTSSVSGTSATNTTAGSVAGISPASKKVGTGKWLPGMFSKDEWHYLTETNSQDANEATHDQYLLKTARQKAIEAGYAGIDEKTGELLAYGQQAVATNITSQSGSPVYYTTNINVSSADILAAQALAKVLAEQQAREARL